MSERWYDEAVVYCLEVESFADSDGDGIGDFRGLVGRLDYLARLGITCLWLNPIHPSPYRDGGYDVTDYYAVDPRYGSLGDFAELLHRAGNRGIKVIIDLVVNHTSDEHPWFRSACSSPDSPYRDWYVWSRREPPDRYQGVVFPGEQRETWTYHRQARAWYDLSRLTADQRTQVFAEFGPEQDMRLYDRGIRRRLAPMLGGDRRRLELAYSLQFTLRGTPVLRYGEEIGMGDDLSLPDRDAIRTPMQWSRQVNAGFTTGADPVRPVISKGQFGYRNVNVTAQRHDATSLLAWFERMIRTLRESPEVGAGRCTPIDQELPRAVLAHRADGPTGCMLFLHNLGTEPVLVDLSGLGPEADHPNQVFGNQEYADVDGLGKLELDGYGYRWIRLWRNPAT